MHDVEVEMTCADWVRDRELALIALHDLKSLIWAVRVCVDMLARGVPEQLADHDVIDDALHAGHEVLHHRGPRKLPNGGADWTFDERAVEW